MSVIPPTVSRRRFIQANAAATLGLLIPNWLPAADSPTDIARGVIPSTGEKIPAIGMGTYISFNVGNSAHLRKERAQVLQTFFDLGGGMIDSSPMYGSSEEVIGHCLKDTGQNDRMFSATKIWTSSNEAGREQMQNSQNYWGIRNFDLQQVHNLVNWKHHLDYLKQLKEAGTIRYLGMTTSHGRRHRELESVLKTEPLDFVQLTYNILDRESEERLIPLAKERNIAVIANRPYQGGRLMDRFQGRPLPDWKDEVGVSNWADFFLKFIISHPDVTCAIPATSQVVHMRENMGALRGKLPDVAGRERMVRYIESL